MSGGLSSASTISGSLSTIGQISGSLTSAGNLIGLLTIPTYIDVDLYEGEYEVTPKFASVELATQNKTLVQDITVNAIPVSITENLSGGNTVYIGG